MTQPGGCILAAMCWAASVPGDPPGYAPEPLAAVSETTRVPESSGVVASRRSRDVYWTHNDSGHEPRVFAFRLSPADRARGVAAHLGCVTLSAAPQRDWEDIAAGPGGRIYLLDAGDNPPCRRTDKRVIRFVEPALDPDGSPVCLAAAWESARIEYPDPLDHSRPAARNDDRYDAECLLVHPVSGDLYVVTKRSSRDVPAARVFRLAASAVAWNTDRLHVLEPVADLSSDAMNMVTAGDVDGRGTRVVLRNYWSAFEYDVPVGGSFEAAFARRPRVILLTQEWTRLLQGEGICYSLDGRALVTTTEAPRTGGDRKFRVFWIPARPAAASAPSCPAIP